MTINKSTTFIYSKSIEGVWCLMPLSTYFSYIVVVSFMSTPRKPPTCSKSMTDLSHNVTSITPRHDTGFELSTLEVIGTECAGAITAVRSQLRM